MNKIAGGPGIGGRGDAPSHRVTFQQAGRVWGNPTRQEVVENTAGKTYTWYWRCADRSRKPNAVVFKQGRVTSIRTSCI